MKIKSESLAYWYLRLNGFLTIVNFIVHPEIGTNQRTDVDVLGVRFPFRAELLFNPMQDDCVLVGNSQVPFAVITEVKASRCKLNGPWTRRKDQNMQRILQAIGLIPPSEINSAADNLYNRGIHQSSFGILSLLCLGKTKNSALSRRYPEVPQITWNHVLRFIHERFNSYTKQKVSHPQWDKQGIDLWNCAYSIKDKDKFVRSFEIE